MKASLGFFVVLMISQTGHAQCKAEAQLIATVEAVQPMPPNACFAKVSEKSVRMYNPSSTCPLELSEVIQAGIEVGLRTEDHCNYHPNEEISGVIFRDVDGTIRLER